MHSSVHNRAFVDNGLAVKVRVHTVETQTVFSKGGHDLG